MKILNDLRHTSLQQLKEHFSVNLLELNTENERGTTPLIAAIASGRTEVVELLLQLGANPNYTSEKATLPLVFAIDGAVEADDYEGKTALTKYLNIIALLIDYKASPLLIDINEGMSALDYYKGRLPEAQSLLEIIC